MDELNYLGQLPRVRAPLGFEAGVLARLTERRERRRRRLKALRFSLAGATAFLLVGFVVTRFVVAPSGTVPAASSNPAGVPAVRVIPINEPVDYAREVRDLSRDSGTIYILEQVSDITTADISY
jgi:hypothetical protein